MQRVDADGQYLGVEVIVLTNIIADIAKFLRAGARKGEWKK